MTINSTAISNLSNLNLVTQLLGKTSTSSLNSLLTSITGASNTTSTLQSVNLTSLNLMTAAGKLTAGNPLTVFTGSSTQDAEDIESAVKSFVSSYNTALSSLSSSSSLINQQAAENLKSLTESNTTALEAIGITIDEEGQLTVDADTLTEAAENNPSAVQSAFNGALSYASSASAISRSSISQTLGLSSSAGFMALYSSSLTSGIGSLLSSSSTYNLYL